MRNKLKYILIYLVLLFKYGFMFVETYSRYTTVILFVLAILVFYQNRGVIYKKAFTTALFLIVGFFATYVVKGFPETSVVIISMSNIIIALLISGAIDRKELFGIFIKIMYLICIFSIVGWIVMMVFHSTVIPLPALKNSAGRVGYYGIFTIISNFAHGGMQRSQGIFWEPGAFQALVVLALLIEKYAFCIDPKPIRKYIYSIAILTTFSTTGYVALMLYWAIELLKIKKVFSYALSIGALLFVFITVNPDILGYINYTLFVKFNAIFEYQVGTVNVSSTRVSSFLLPLEMFVNNPINFIFGNGQEGVEMMNSLTGTNMATCTPINYIVKFGLPIGCVSYYGFYRLISVVRENFFVKLLIMALAIITFSSEAFDFSLFFNMLLFYGITIKREGNVYENC